MGEHRAPGRHRAGPARRRRARRGGRFLLTTLAVLSCVLAIVGGINYLPTVGEVPPASSMDAAGDQTEPFISTPDADGDEVSRSGGARAPSGPSKDRVTERPAPDEAVPERSGVGRRVVFSADLQRVWLIAPGNRVTRTYPVSGSIYDNLFPGTYQVFSRSRHAYGIDDSGTMEYFVRFTYGTGGAAIGFHTIPVDDGGRVQTIADLGTPLSHGCIRQATSDAVALWEFAQLGTTVVVTP